MGVRGRLAAALITAIVLAGVAGVASAGEREGSGRPREAGGRASLLKIYYTNPVLVPAGEPVRIPVDVVCATSVGRACAATAEVEALQGGAWATGSSPASAGLRFDLSVAAGAAASGAGGRASGAVRFFVRARDASGRTVSLPDGAPDRTLRFYVATSMPVVRLPAVPFGRARRGRTVLRLPWGTGPRRAGLTPGDGSAALGPSSFDVDAGGRVYLLDELQRRLAVFSRGRLVRSTRLPVPPLSDVAVAENGTAYVLARDPRDGSRLQVRTVSPAGRVTAVVPVGTGIPGEIRTAGAGAYVHLLPLDAWVPVPGTGAATSVAGPSAGRPLPSGDSLLRSVAGNALRLGTVSGGEVRRAVELRSTRRLGEAPLAEPDGRGGYWAVVHVWRGAPHAADQYEVVHVLDGRVVRAFAAPRREYAQAAPLSAFRMGADGALYHLQTEAAGLRVVRYRIGGDR